jgi:hypothetical protein
MTLPLTYQYAYDWRVRLALWRQHVGTKDFLSISRKAQLREAFWVAALLLATVLALQARVWPLFVLMLALAAWRSVMFFGYVTTVRQALFTLRSTFRESPRKELWLRVDESGLREVDGEVESFAPWSAVKSFFSNDKLVAIELHNSQWACVAVQTLKPASSPVESLVAELEKRSVVRCARPGFLLR